MNERPDKNLRRIKSERIRGNEFSKSDAYKKSHRYDLLRTATLSTDIAPLVCVSAYWPHLSAISIRTHLERLFLASRMAGIVKTWRTAVNRGSLRFGSGVTTMERSNYRTNAAGNRGPLPLREPSISRRNTRATVTSGHRDERNNQTCRASFSVNPVGKRPRVVDGYRSNRRYDGRNDVEEARTSTTIARLRSMKQR